MEIKREEVEKWLEEKFHEEHGNGDETQDEFFVWMDNLVPSEWIDLLLEFKNTKL